MDELKDKHARGVQERDDPDRAPTGEPYRQIQRQGMERARQEQTRKEEERQVQIMRIQELKEQVQRQVNKEENGGDGDDEDDSDDEWLNELESDPTLEAIREQRLEQMRREHLQKLENRAKGHGEYRTISQDDPPRGRNNHCGCAPKYPDARWVMPSIESKMLSAPTERERTGSVVQARTKHSSS